jgi:hypothetical protein
MQVLDVRVLGSRSFPLKAVFRYVQFALKTVSLYQEVRFVIIGSAIYWRTESNLVVLRTS